MSRRPTSSPRALAVLVEDFHEVYRIDHIAHCNYGVVIACGVFDQLLQPAALELQPDAEYQVSVGNTGDVLCAGLVGVRISVGR